MSSQYQRPFTVKSGLSLGHRSGGLGSTDPTERPVKVNVYPGVELKKIYCCWLHKYNLKESG